MLSNEMAVRRALTSGSIAAVLTALTAAVAGRREAASYAAPLNATSHILWGEQATWRNQPTLKYTGVGVLLTYGAAVFWAALYEKLFGRARRSARSQHPVAEGALRAIGGAAAVSAGAYVTDYHLMPRRLTPGYERRVSGKSLATIFAALALGLAARDVVLALGRRA